MTTKEAPSLTPLQRAFLALEQAEARLKAVEAAAREPVAIIGMACRLPGAENVGAYWQLLRDGVDAIGPVPDGRFDLNALHVSADAAHGDVTGGSVTCEAGFLPRVDGFDPEFFGVTRREAHGMDPQQRLLLEVSWEALEAAGRAPDTLERSGTGVYFGLCSNDYANLQLQAGDPSLLDAHYTSGLAHSVASGRVSYVLGLQGPSLTVDTACSSSLVAVHLACQGLRAGDCDMALAGGVNLMLSPDLFVAFSSTRMISPDGRCKTFDAAADGFGRGEGCGVVVLKRLSRAQADGDRILAVIRGSAVNQDGPSSGLTAPNGPQQEAVIRDALERAGVQPRQVGYVEAHGTGTRLGDPLEVQALGEVFGRERDGAPDLVIGSVKTNIGHLEAAAGVAGLIKLVLSLQNRAIPPHLHFRRPSPHVPWSALPLRVPTTLTPWAAIDGRRIAGLSSFGFSGTNTHLIIEEAPAPPASAPSARANPMVAHLFVCSARTRVGLHETARAYAADFARRENPDLCDLCYTAAVGKAHHAWRAMILAEDAAQLVDRLTALASGRDADGLRVAHVERGEPPRIAFLFTGQGSQYAGMARVLDEEQPAFRAALDRCAAVLDPVLEHPLRQVLFGDVSSTLLHQTGLTQPALFAVEFAMVELWRSWGVAPQMAIGHSVGELVAACIAGAVSLDDALTLVAERARLMQSLPAGGAMAAIDAPESVVADALRGNESLLAIAAINGPEQTVVSGHAAAVEALCARLAATGARTQALSVSHAFHSPLVEPILEPFEAAARRVTFARPRLRLISNLHGEEARADEMARPEYWRRHIRETVRFADGLRTLAGMKPDICIEVGPQPTLLGFVQSARASFGDSMPLLVPSLRRGRDDRQQLAESLGALYLAGVPLDWRPVTAANRGRIVDLPSYPFERERCWFEASARPTRGRGAGSKAGPGLLGERVRSPLTGVVQFERPLRSNDIAFLRDHRVQGRAILPATGFLELAWEAGARVSRGAPVARDVTIAAPLVFEGDETRLVQVVVHDTDAERLTFEVLSVADADPQGAWQLHAQGTLDTHDDDVAVATPDRSAIQARCRQQIDADGHYARLAKHGLDFGPSLRGLERVWRRDGEALGQVVLPNAAHEGPSEFVLDPALLDACLQCLAWALPEQATSGRAWLPLAFDRARFVRAPGPQVWAHVIVETRAAKSATLRADLQVVDDAGLVAELNGITLRPANASESPFYEIVWQRDSDTPASASWIPDLAPVVSAAVASFPALAVKHDLDSHHRATLALDAYCGAKVAASLRELGWDPSPGVEVEADVLARELGVASRHRRLFGRLLEILGEDGSLARAPARRWRVVRALSERGSIPADDALATAHAGSRARAAIVRRCLDALPAILRGEIDPLDRLFPGGSTRETEALYRETPEAGVYNQLVRDTLVELLRGRPAGRTLRVLEVGGGTGGTTAWLAPALPPDCADYLFTDVGPALVARAREQFGHFPFMRFGVFDLEREATSQGLSPGGFDVILAANVVHATADLRASLANLRSLLAPGGVLLLLEIGARERWIDVTFGLTDGWWRFTDHELRQDYPLLDRAQWLRLLEECDFEASTLDPPHAASNEVVLAARRPRNSQPRPLTGTRWVVVGEGEGLADALGARLRGAGAETELLDTATLASDDIAARLNGVSGIVHLGCLDAEELQPDSPSSLPQAQREVLTPLLALAQAIGRASFAAGATPRLWVATRGAQPVTGDSTLALAQATSWGFGRALSVECPELLPTWIDLDPARAAQEQVEPLFTAIAGADDELQLALRNGARLAARLDRLGDPAAGPRDLVHLVKSPNGLLEGMKLEPSRRRHPGRGEIEIRVRATALNFRDVMNAMAMREDPEPLGGECAGWVSAVGAEVHDFRVGDRVVALAEDCFATYAICDARHAAALPPGVGEAAATTVPFAFMTARHALVELGRMTRGSTVLIHAAAGGVGSAAVQLALRAGATVFATAGSERKRARLRNLGITHVLDSRSIDFSRQVLDLTHGRGVDLVLNSLAGEFIEGSVRCLAAGGTFLEIGKSGIWTEERFRELRPGARYFAIDLAEMRVRDRARWRALFDGVISDLRQHAIAPLPFEAFPLNRVRAAFECMAQARHVGKVVVTQVDDAAGALESLRPDATYLITGGLAGLGLATATHLADHGARHLMLIGRRAIDAAQGPALEALRARGIDVRVEQADVADHAQLARVIAIIDAQMPTLRGVVHSAGTLADAALQQQDWSRFDRVLGPKVYGSWALHVLTLGHPLDFFVLYSSVAAVFGSAGQANHAAANAFLDALASHRRALGLLAVSIGWGAWGKIGAAADRGIQARLESQGIGAIDPPSGFEMLDQASVAGRAHVVACRIDWPTLLGARPLRASGRFLERLRPRAQAAPNRLAASVEASEPRRAAAPSNAAWLAGLRDATPARRLEHLLTFVGEQVARVVRAPGGASIDPRQPLNELGLDSLMAVELRNRLSSGLALERVLPATLVFDHPTLDALARYLSELLFPAVTPPAAASSASTTDSIDDLSEDEIERLFATRTRGS